jgi:hypothetical protein
MRLEPRYILGDCAFELARFDAAISEPFVTFQLALLPFDGLPIGRWREQEHALCGAPESNKLIAFVLNVLRGEDRFPQLCSF